MDLTSIVEDTERTRFGLQTERQMNGRINLNQYTPLNFVGVGYND